jgi:hypothetical protein
MIGDKPVAGLTNKDVADVLRPIGHDKRATANRVRSRVELIINHAMAKEWHHGPNPAHLAMLTAFLGRAKEATGDALRVDAVDRNTRVYEAAGET